MSSQLPAPANPAHMFVHLRRPIRIGSLVRRQYFDPQTPLLSYSYSALRLSDQLSNYEKNQNLSSVILQSCQSSLRSRSVKYSSKLLVNRLLVGVNRHLRSKSVKYSSKVLVHPSLAAIIVPGADPWRVQAQSLLVIGRWHRNSLQSRSMEISSVEFINPFFDSVCIQSLSKVLINSLFIIFIRSRSAKSSSAELVVVVLLPQRRTRKKKQLLTVIRDFASEKTQEERRVSDLKNQVGELRSEIEVATANIEEAMKRKNSPAAAIKCLHDSDSFVDVNFVGDVCLKVRKAEVVLREESPNEVRAGYEEFKTDVTALFLAVHNGNVALVRKLLSIGADVNQKLFRGYATTVAVRENHLEILEMLLKAGASQQACEEALLEASCYGHARIAELLMGSDLIRPRIAVHALFTACCRGFANVVDALLKCGVDVNAISRVLLQSCKPSLHTNVDCTALVAAIVSRQVSVVRLLLEAGAKTDVKVRLGAWSWDAASGEEFRVGAGLADPYDITWCAVEYFEESGSILRSLLEDMPPNMSHCGRTLLHHAILCGNAGAVKVLLECGAHVESPVKTTRKTEFCPLHMAVRLGFSTVLKCLIDFGCDIDSKTESSETGLMNCARYKQEECLKILLRHGADLGLVNTAGQSASSIAGSNRWQLGFQEAVLSIIHDGKVPKSSNMSIFSPLLFVAQSGDVLALKALIEQGINLDNQDESGFSAVMVAAKEGHVDTFRLLVFSGANVRLCTKSGDTALTLCALNHKRDLFEKVLLEFAIEQGNRYAGGFYALHCAARRGDLDAVKVLLSRGYDVNVSDVDGNTPLILAAREGHSQACEVLISHGACCDAKNAKGETALSLARTKHKNEAEQVILDELARKLVLTGSHLQKHTKGGKGAVHIKEVRMVEGGILCWGKSSRRNVICQAAEVGPSVSFRKTRQRKGDTEEAGLFRVITTKNKEVHFVCEGGFEMAELWVRGLKLGTREAVSGRGNIM